MSNSKPVDQAQGPALDAERAGAHWARLAEGAGDANASCPRPESLFAAALGELDTRESASIVDHVSRCPLCAEGWRMALRAPSRAEAVDAPRAGRAAFSGRRRGTVRATRAALGLLAASLVFAALVAVLPWRQAALLEREAVSAPFRDAGGAALVALEDSGERLDPRAPRLVWSSAGEGARYRVVLTTLDLELLVERGGLAATSLEPDPALFADLEPGAIVLWHVEARLPGGARLRSPTYGARVESEPGAPRP